MVRIRYVCSVAKAKVISNQRQKKQQSHFNFAVFRLLLSCCQCGFLQIFHIKSIPEKEVVFATLGKNKMSFVITLW